MAKSSGPQPEIIDRIVTELAEGKSLGAICRQPHMPSRQTVVRWQSANPEIYGRIMEAREIGFHDRAERAVEAAKTAKDPIAGRLAFDAERWFLGKLSNAFADKPLIGVALNVGGDEAFADIAGALERAAASIAGSATGTQPVVIDSPARSGDADG